VVHTTRTTTLRLRLSINEARSPGERHLADLLDAELVVEPAGRFHAPSRLLFGTLAEPFDVQTGHTSIEIPAARPSPALPGHRRGDRRRTRRTRMDPYDPNIEFTLPSPMVHWTTRSRHWPGRWRRTTVVATALSINDWLTANITYSTGSTIIGTSVSDVMPRGRASARTSPRRLRPAALQRRRRPLHLRLLLLGAARDGTSFRGEGHAWGRGARPYRRVVGVRPDQRPAAGDRHVKVGHGRDYSDVCRCAGSIGWRFRSLRVDVTMRRLEAAKLAD